MIETDDDLADVFYDADDFAYVCTPVRAGVAGAPFAGILGTIDEDRFDGQAVGGTYQLQFPAQAGAGLQVGDTLRTQRKLEDGTLSTPPQLWQVLRTPLRVVDGRECMVWLAPAGV